MEYRGTFEDFKNIVCKTGVKITAEKPLYSQSIKIGHRLKVSTGAIVNWYEKKEHFNFKVEKSRSKS
ncbi:hypothetical protein GCM10023261_13830 [Bartonella jaculi]|uniref:Uncharacterized protein n=1 Tax=Bartonella jaculi TaxID=686226 RepID=A0ABP9N7F2_9HYPH